MLNVYFWSLNLAVHMDILIPVIIYFALLIYSMRSTISSSYPIKDFFEAVTATAAVLGDQTSEGRVL